MSRKVRLLFVATVWVVLAATAPHAVAEQAVAPLAKALNAAPDDPAAVDEVTVRAQRAGLAAKVLSFVDHIAGLENEEGLPRWNHTKVCPSVSGLPRQEAEFILGRVSEIARAAGVPLGDEHCHANLYILVSTEPEKLLQGMRKRNRLFTFGQYGDEFPSAVDHFIRTPRAVRVWYNSVECDEDGVPLWRGAHLFQPSRLRFNVTWHFSSVFVIVDQRRLHAVSRGQLADYVALVGLAELKPDAQLHDAPTILRLFAAAPAAAPAGMSGWDEAFLRSLYATEPTSKLQRGQMARVMVRAIVH